MSLIALQRRFCTEIILDDDGAPPSSPGMAVYRNAYRARLLDCLGTTFEKTRHWTGEESFMAAACHHILIHPPHCWTLDDYGADFPETLATLFRDNPDVAELAGLEWDMQRVFANPDEPVFTLDDLQTLVVDSPDWNRLCFELGGGVALRPVRTACDTLWLALTRDDPPTELPVKSKPRHVIVWRAGDSSQFRMLDREEAEALRLLSDAQPFGAICASLAVAHGNGDVVARLGGWLARWIGDGLIAQATERSG